KILCSSGRVISGEYSLNDKNDFTLSIIEDAENYKHPLIFDQEGDQDYCISVKDRALPKGISVLSELIDGKWRTSFVKLY
ncbi:MAG: hypothetical protein AAFQ01_04725, partial [Bacteroidota bacterium]